MAIFSAIWLYSASSALTSATPSSTLPRTVLLSSSTGSWPSMPTVKPGIRRASPLDGCSSPAIIRSRVDFPMPFGPTTPIFAPGRNARVTLSSMAFSPYAFRTARIW